MTHTLWRAAELLGEGDLAPLPSAGGVLGGPFRPTPAFAAAWPAFQALQAVQASLVAAFGALPPGTGGADAMRALLVGTGVGEALAAAVAAVEALGLEVRDPAGHALAGVHVGVAAWSFPVPDDIPPALRAVAERDLADAGLALDAPNYLLMVTPRPGRPAAHAGTSPSAI